MELPHAIYFYTLAQVGITFAGFATILMALRETRGRGMSKFHLWVAKSYIQSGLVTAMSAMLAVSWNLFGFFAQFAESVNFFFETEDDPVENENGK